MNIQLRPKILLIDDSNLVQLKIKSLLKKNYFNLAGEATDGVKGLAKYSELSPDIILLDMVMDKMDGLEFLKKIREKDKKTIVIVISSHSDLPRIQEAMSLGINNYIVKPINDKNLLEIIRLEWKKFKFK